MMKHDYSEFMPQMRPSFGIEEKELVCNYLDGDGYITEFQNTFAFETALCNYTGFKHCIAVNNGTISLTLSALALGLKPGDEVIVPNFTMIATVNSMQMIGLTPKFVDVEYSTLCLDLELVKTAITSKTKAIILVNANGREPSVGIEAFRDLAASRNLFLIEDSAQALGSAYRTGQHIGTQADIASFSFSAPKIISTGQGGIVATNSDELATKVKKLKDFGRSSGGNDIHDSLGYNFKFTELQALIGLGQMQKLGERVIEKKAIYDWYREELNEIEEVELIENDTKYTAPWFYEVRTKDRENLISTLKHHGIGSRPMYPPINYQECWNVPGEHPVSNEIGERGLWLPSMSDLSREDVKKVGLAIKAHFSGK